MALDTAAAESAMAKLAADLGLSVEEAAWGVYDLVSENMAGAARVHIVEKGRDPRRYAMVAMGGAGPLHAARVARKLGVREVVVPPASGAASALGFLAAPVAYEAARSWPMRIAEPDFARVESLLRGLESEGRARLAEAGVAEAAPALDPRPDDGAAPATSGSEARPGREGVGFTVQRQADMRLRGQMHQISVPLPAEPLSAENLPAVLDAFAAEYQRRYTHLYDGAEIEVLNWRVVCTGPAPDLSARLADGDAGRSRRRARGRRRRTGRRPEGTPPGMGAGTRRLRRRSGVRPLCDGSRVRDRGAGDRRGARGDHRRARRLHAHRGRGAQPSPRPRRDGAVTDRRRCRYRARGGGGPHRSRSRSGSRSCGAG